MRLLEARGGWARRVRGLFVAVLDLVYPRDCMACGAVLTGVHGDCLCDDCLSSLKRIGSQQGAAKAAQMRVSESASLYSLKRIGPEQCPRCGDQIGPFADGSRACKSCGGGRTLVFHGASAVFRYEGPAREAVHRLKYSGDLRAVRWMGREMAARLGGTDWFGAVDVIIPVPLHRSRRIERRFNQSELLARGIARRCGKPFQGSALRRTQKTVTQARLESSQREQNVRGVFRVFLPSRVAGKVVLLVDDVMTTCATATECARALMAAGAKSVYVAVLAR